ncbi:sensor histidine kinase [Actinomadura rupiterrae]|uniref:sensor histidine kinase n=1 Tax=Actinomadura rupiterrae TaxID=559627 RepID=UPI0020A4C5D7|nr:nitrate- and nitrite sensing domain-containing protein [Actinomadura rupiterrae]MCP2334708.1 signal transduction histidine kinase [Actinomadura rupiterrae]
MRDDTVKSSRRRSIRISLYSMLVIPLVSLVVLWAFAAQSVAAQAIDQRHIDTANKIYGNAVQPMLITLAQERQESVVWIAAHGKLPRASMDAVRQKMDGTVVQMNRAARSGSFQNTLTPLMKQRLATLIDKLNRLNTIRGQVDSGAFDKLSAFNAYNDVLDSHFRFIYLLVAENGYQQAYHLTGMSRAMELAGREAALVGGVLVSGGRMSADERTAIAQLVFERRYLETSSLSEFNEANGAPYKAALGSAAARNFAAVENRILAVPSSSKLKLAPATWQGAVGGYLQQMDGALGKSRVTLAADAKKTSDDTLLRLALIGAVGLAALLLTALLMLRFGRRIVRDLRDLQGAAHDLADQRLPDVVTRLKRGDAVDVSVEAPPLVVGRSAEVGSVADAFSTVQRTAIEAAVGQADLRKAVSGVFQNLARRNQSLLHRQLSMLDTLERKAADPDDLADLFAIDHLTTRMRRHAEGLIILSGATPGRGWRRPVGILDALRGAIGEIEDYARVEVVSNAEEGIDGAAAADVVHLLAELIENAVTFSPPNTPVEVDAGMVGRGFVVEIQDRGLGVTPDKLAALNERLGREPEFDLSGGEQLGLLVVGTLAHRHGIRVVLEPNSYGGLKAIVLLPHSIVVSADRINQPEPPEGAPEDDSDAAPMPVGADAQMTSDPASYGTPGSAPFAPSGSAPHGTSGNAPQAPSGGAPYGNSGGAPSSGGVPLGAGADPQGSGPVAMPVGSASAFPHGPSVVGGASRASAGPSGIERGTDSAAPRMSGGGAHAAPSSDAHRTGGIGGWGDGSEAPHPPGAHTPDAHTSRAQAPGAHASGAHASGAHISDAHASDAHTSDAHTSGAQAPGAHASGAHASGAYISDAHSSGAHSSGAHASDAQASGAHGSGAHGSGAHGSGANASGANASDVHGSDVRGSGAHVGGMHAGMPRRVRRASLAPELRNAEGEQQPASSGASEGTGGRSPERARSVMGAMQSGWRRGRAEPPVPRRPERWNDGEVER